MSSQALTGRSQSSGPKTKGSVHVEDYSEFLICQEGDAAAVRQCVSVCEQRNAAFVRMALEEEREEGVSREVEVLIVTVCRD